VMWQDSGKMILPSRLAQKCKVSSCMWLFPGSNVSWG